MTKNEYPEVVIVGAGFGGLFAAKRLTRENVHVTLVDRNNYHTFTPLLYQVATASLDPSEIAYPVRSFTKRWSNVRFVTGEVINIDKADRQIGIRAFGGEYSMPFSINPRWWQHHQLLWERKPPHNSLGDKKSQ